ncbi:MAG: TrkH family potassium uptake protein [Bacteroidetes bacterium]|nr:TrkH family potassium uptake protein [Bacteroidota bacterium]
MLNYKVILNILGFLLILNGFLMLFALPFSLYYKSGDVSAILTSAMITALVGAVLWFSTRKNENKNIGKKEGYLIVSSGWLVISLFGALPYLISGAIPNYTDAFFESISGFTTTGASILNDIEAMPKGILFWRSMTQWIGGMGIIVLSLAILPFLGIGGMQLFVAEVTGVTTDKLHPHIKETAKRLWGIYVLLTIIQTGFLLFGGMDLYDAFSHSFTTMAIGGFSTKQASIAYYSPFIQYVIIVFMFLAGMNFALHYFSLKLNFKKIWANEEFWFYSLIIGAFTLIVTLGLYVGKHTGLEQSFRDACFQVVSIVTTTGFVTSDHQNWGPLLGFLIFALMFIGGCAGSTAGGIKVVRHLLLWKNCIAELKRLLHPNAIIPVRLNGKAVSVQIMSNVLAFFLLYIIVFAFGCVFMSMLGLDFKSAIGSVIASLGNIGPGIGSVGPTDNYHHIPDAGKWFLSFLMILGRLELFTVLILFSRGFWRR